MSTQYLSNLYFYYSNSNVENCHLVEVVSIHPSRSPRGQSDVTRSVNASDDHPCTSTHSASTSSLETNKNIPILKHASPWTMSSKRNISKSLRKLRRSRSASTTDCRQPNDYSTTVLLDRQPSYSFNIGKQSSNSPRITRKTSNLVTENTLRQSGSSPSVVVVPSVRENKVRDGRGEVLSTLELYEVTSNPRVFNIEGPFDNVTRSNMGKIRHRSYSEEFISSG